ncbi:hypothetical protein G6F68_017848 [Rhizopus microsporus]|nr:hypothetical protein G6F68_017848 [Rhizopus microsporus]
MYEHLSDIASHITTLRTQNVYRGIPRRVEAPPKSDDNLLLDTTAMVEHIKLQRAVQQATQLQSNRKRNNGPRSKRSAPRISPLRGIFNSVPTNKKTN